MDGSRNHRLARMYCSVAADRADTRRMGERILAPARDARKTRLAPSDGPTGSGGNAVSVDNLSGGRHCVRVIRFFLKQDFQLGSFGKKRFLWCHDMALAFRRIFDLQRSRAEVVGDTIHNPNIPQGPGKSRKTFVFYLVPAVGRLPGGFRGRTDADAGGKALVIGGDGLAVFLDTCQIALDRIDGHPPRLAQRTTPRNAPRKDGHEDRVPSFRLRPENDLVAHGQSVSRTVTRFKRSAFRRVCGIYAGV